MASSSNDAGTKRSSDTHTRVNQGRSFLFPHCAKYFSGNKGSRHQFCTVNPEPERFVKDGMVQRSTAQTTNSDEIQVDHNRDGIHGMLRVSSASSRLATAIWDSTRLGGD